MSIGGGLLIFNKIWYNNKNITYTKQIIFVFFQNFLQKWLTKQIDSVIILYCAGRNLLIFVSFLSLTAWLNPQISEKLAHKKELLKGEG